MALDVDKFRPGTVPLVAENILWFEFLLDPTLLERHLNSPKPDPSPFDLISKFSGFDSRTETAEIDKCDKDAAPNSFKTLALKILTMKVMAHLKWDLDVLEPKLPPKLTMQVLTDLLCIATSEVVSMDPYPVVDYNSSMDHQSVFAVLLYHRWILKSLVYNTLAWKHPRMLFIPTQGGQDPNAIAAKKREDLRMMLEAQAQESVATISRILETVDTLTVPTFGSFIQPTEASQQVTTKWEQGAVISANELKCQIHFELGQFLMFRREHDAARLHLGICWPLFQMLEKEPSLKSDFEFCRIEKAVLLGLTVGANVPVTSNLKSSSLIDRFRESKWNHFQGIIQVLQMDNLLREVPLAERDLVEVEIQQAISCGTLTVAKDLLMKLQVLNALRRVMVQESPAINVLQVLRNGGDRAVDFFLTSIHSVIVDVSAAEQQNLHRFLFDLMLRDKFAVEPDSSFLTSVILADEVIRDRFTASELAHLEGHIEENTSLVPFSLIQNISLPLIARSPRLEVKNIQHQLAETYDPAIIKILLQKLSSKDPGKAWFRENTRCDVPIPLQSAVMHLPRGFIQDLVYILVAKSRELSNRKEFTVAMTLLKKAAQDAKEAQGISSGALFKLTRLLDWEILLVEINQYLETYPKHTKELGPLVLKCKACLAASSAGESVIPRLEILESCAIALLNLSEWETLIAMDKRLVYLELAGALAYACQDVSKYNASKKLPWDAWDLVLPVFGPVAQKRNSCGSTVSPTGASLTKSSLVRFVLQLREPTVIDVTTSLLAKLHNVLRDESSLEINCIYTSLWPAMVSNSNSYNARFVAEVLSQVTVQALKFMPNNCSMLKLMGDLHYGVTDWENALRYYLEAGAVASDFFTQLVPKAVLDDFALKRMIKCCSQLSCYTQAAVLCQCLDDVDYSTAFRCLAETKNLHCSDAMDAYYPCIWDLTLLEYLVNMHSKRGEAQRKQQVIKIMGLLELNSNNNDEIKREAANVRRSKLLRALIGQYSVSSSFSTPLHSNGTLMPASSNTCI